MSATAPRNAGSRSSLTDALRPLAADRTFATTLRAGREAFSVVWVASSRAVGVTVALQVVAGALIGVQLLLAQRVINDLTTEGDIGISASLAAIIVLSTVTGVIAAALPDLLADIGERVAAHTADEVLRVTTAVEAITFEEPAFHDLLQRASFAAQSSNRDIPAALLGLIGAATATVSVLIAVAVIEPLIVPLVLFAGVPVLWTNRNNSRLYQNFVHDLTEHDRRRMYFWNVLTSRAAVRETRAHRMSSELQDRHRALYLERVEAFHQLNVIRVRRSVVGALLSSIVVAVTIVFLVVRLEDGALEAGAVGAAILAVLVLTQRIRAVLLSAGRIYESALFIDDYLAFLDLPATPTRPPTTAAPVEEIRGTGLAFTYPDSTGPSIVGIDVEARRGQVIALVGENGSGKTTLAQLLGGVYPAGAGEIVVDGVAIDPTDLDALRDRVSFVFQDFVKWALSGSENVSLGRLGAETDLDTIREAARRAGADEFLAAKAQGYETVLSRLFKGGSDLSVGQWQRVATARAIHRDAPILVFDEPTASLDPVAEREIFRLLREQMNDRIVILISHRLSSVRSADVIYVLEHGRVVETGDHESLVRAGGAYQRLYEAQAAPFTEDEG